MLSQYYCNYNRKPVVSEEYGPMVNPRLCILGPGENVSYKWQVFFLTVDEGKYCSETINSYWLFLLLDVCCVLLLPFFSSLQSCLLPVFSVFSF